MFSTISKIHQPEGTFLKDKDNSYCYCFHHCYCYYFVILFCYYWCWYCRYVLAVGLIIICYSFVFEHLRQWAATLMKMLALEECEAKNLCFDSVFGNVVFPCHPIVKPVLWITQHHYHYWVGASRLLWLVTLRDADHYLSNLTWQDVTAGFRAQVDLTPLEFFLFATCICCFYLCSHISQGMPVGLNIEDQRLYRRRL